MAKTRSIEEGITEHVTLINYALEQGNIELFISNLYAFQKYIDETLSKQFPKGLKAENLQAEIANKYSNLFEKLHVNNEFMFLAVQEILSKIKSNENNEFSSSNQLQDVVSIENGFFTFFELLGRRGISSDANKYSNETFKKVFLRDKKPNIEEMDPDNIIMHQDSDTLTAYWLEEGKLASKEIILTDENKKIQTYNYILNNLPKPPSLVSENAILITRIKFGFECLHDKERKYNDYLNKNLDPVIERIKNKDMLENASIKHFSFDIPIEGTSSKVKDLFPNSNDFKQKLYKYQIENAKKVYDAQIKLIESNGEELEDNGPRIAFNFLRHIQDLILSTTWKVSDSKAIKVVNQQGEFIHKVPPNMAKMITKIKNAYDQDPTGKTEIWKRTFNEVADIGRKASKQIFASLFRDKNVHKFYKQFQDAHLYDKEMKMNRKK